MEIKNPRKSIYLPLFISLAIVIGFLLGLKLAPVAFHQDKVQLINTERYNKINDIINYISQDYVDSISKEQLEQDAIDGILTTLDPHSQYIPAEDFNEVNDPLHGNFEGIGIQFRIEKDTILVLQTIASGPSEKVGLMAGDRIVKINDTLVAGTGITNKDAIGKLKGKRGTKVDIKVYRPGKEDLLDFSIIRDVIPTYSVDIAYMVDDSVGYIKVSKFSATTYEEFIKAMTDLQQKGMSKLILDLRGNYGGYLDASIRMSDEFLKENTLIVYTEGDSRPNNYAYATKKGIFEDNDLVILIDEGSASASEIVAGAIQDNDRGTIVGRRSFGKGLVQEQLNLPDGSALRLTVARYHTPTGRNIQRSYENGTEDYYADYYHRFVDGEMFNADSVEINDSLKYTTAGGKTVYGGGGIMPDIYVPLANEEEDWYYNQLLRKNIIFQFAFEYTDRNRPSLTKFSNIELLESDFKITPDIFQDLIKYAEKEGVTATAKQIRDSKKKTEVLLKAYIARNLLDDKGFYPVFHEIDEIFLKGYEVLNTR